MRDITEQQFVSELCAVIVNKYGTQACAAKAWQCSREFVRLVVNGKRKPSFIMEQDVRYERIESVTYRKIK